MECESVRLNRCDGFFIFARAPTYRKKIKNETVRTFCSNQNYFWPARWGDRVVGQRYGERVPVQNYGLASDVAKCRITGWPAMGGENADLGLARVAANGAQRCGERLQT